MIGSILALGFPLTYYMLIFGFLIGIGVAAVFLGTVSVAVVFCFLVLGVIRIMPLVEVLGRVFEALFPGVQGTIRENIKDSFPLHGTAGKEPAIYLWHPHGLFSMSHFFHVGTNYTDWPVRTIQGTAIHWFWWIPFGKELLELSGFVPSHYKSMKKVLEDGKSLSVTLGGVREILHSSPNSMRLNIASRKGVFKMAIETGRPLIPVLVYGEHEVYEIEHWEWLDRLNTFLVEYALYLPIPTSKSCWNWIQLIQKPLEKKVVTHIGEPVVPVQTTNPTDSEICALREQYFTALRTLYAKTRPKSYAKELEIV